MKYIKHLLFSLLLIVSSFSTTLHAADSCTGSGCISSSEFTIDTKYFSPNSNTSSTGGLASIVAKSGGDTSTLVNNILGDFIKKMLIVFGVLSLLIMTIGGGYMIFHLGEESLLSRGKTIFMWGLISLAIVLSAGIMVNLVIYILY